jgi:NAD(P)-dependent dehydrogenase (short-subunit alcohol dehydrogenase family)
MVSSTAPDVICSLILHELVTVEVSLPESEVFLLIVMLIQQGFAGLSVYCGTKFFVEGLSQGMRQEVAEFGVKVTCIQPGDVKTDLFERTTDQEVGICLSNLSLHFHLSHPTPNS